MTESNYTDDSIETVMDKKRRAFIDEYGEELGYSRDMPISRKGPNSDYEEATDANNFIASGD